MIFVFLQSVFIFYIFSYEPVTYGTDYNYPKWAEYMGLCMSFASMVWVPLYAVYYVLTQPGTFKEVWFLFFFWFRLPIYVQLAFVTGVLTNSWHAITNPASTNSDFFSTKFSITLKNTTEFLVFGQQLLSGLVLSSDEKIAY